MQSVQLCDIKFYELLKGINHSFPGQTLHSDLWYIAGNIFKHVDNMNLTHGCKKPVAEVAVLYTRKYF